MRKLSWVPLLALGAGCAGPGAGSHRAPPSPAFLGPAGGMTGVPAEYTPAFDALRAAVDAHEDATARLVLARVQRRLEADRAASWDDLRPEERRGLESALALAEGFGRILGGRERVAALDLALEVAVAGNGHRLSLVVDSRWDGPLELRPGPANLRETLVWVSPDGRESRIVRELPVEDLGALSVDGESAARTVVARTPSGLPRGALAASWTWSLELRSGGVADGDEHYPAMGWTVAGAERTELAAWLPTSPVEPAELAEYLARPDLTVGPPQRALPPIMERAVRIPLEQRAEALALLGPLVERGTREEIERMVPALRWLSRRASLGSDPEAWRRWMRVRGEPDEEPIAGIDLPRRR